MGAAAELEGSGRGKRAAVRAAAGEAERAGLSLDRAAGAVQKWHDYRRRPRADRLAEGSAVDESWRATADSDCLVVLGVEQAAGLVRPGAGARHRDNARAGPNRRAA